MSLYSTNLQNIDREISDLLVINVPRNKQMLFSVSKLLRTQITAEIIAILVVSLQRYLPTSITQMQELCSEFFLRPAFQYQFLFSNWQI